MFVVSLLFRSKRGRGEQKGGATKDIKKKKKKRFRRVVQSGMGDVQQALVYDARSRTTPVKQLVFFLPAVPLVCFK